MNKIISKNKTNKIIQLIEINSQRPIENKELVKDYISRSLVNSKQVTFYSWECPPRFIDKDKNGKIFINYNVDLKSIFQGKKIDRFTELPKVIKRKNTEIETLKFIKSLGIKFCFVKLIADSNAFYLTPESLKILGKQKVINKFNEFKKLIKKYTDKYPIDTKVYLFTDLIKRFINIYDNSFKQAVGLLQDDSQKLIPKRILKQQLIRTKKHIGLRDLKLIKEFSINTIATYAAEGMIFNKLTETKKLSNCIWLNLEEVDERVIVTTNCLRIKRNLGKLPMVFIGI